MIGCEYRKYCWIVDLDCFLTKFEHCRNKETARWVMEERAKWLDERYNRVQEDFKLQMELQR